MVKHSYIVTHQQPGQAPQSWQCYGKDTFEARWKWNNLWAGRSKIISVKLDPSLPDVDI
jgi:hypothetical protein